MSEALVTNSTPAGEPLDLAAQLAEWRLMLLQQDAQDPVDDVVEVVLAWGPCA